MKKILITLVLCMFGFTVSANTIINKKEFTENYAAVAEKKVDGLTVKIKGNLEIEFTHNNGSTSTAYLDNAYKDYLSNPDELSLVLETYSSSLIEIDETIENNLGIENIFPVVKDRNYIKQITEYMKRKEGGGPFPFYYEKINDVLYLLYAFDTPSSTRYMPKEDISKLGVKESDLKDISKANLKKSIPSVTIEGDPSTISMLVADGTYEASFLLLDELWTKEKFPVKGDIVVYVPSRDTVLITGSEDVEGLETLRDIVYNSQRNWSHAVADVGFIRSENGWELFGK